MGWKFTIRQDSINVASGMASSKGAVCRLLQSYITQYAEEEFNTMSIKITPQASQRCSNCPSESTLGSADDLGNTADGGE